jgi:hypothetical protein
MAQEIHTNDGERDSCQQEGPGKWLALERQVNSLFTPARDELTCRSSQLGARGWSSREVGKDGVAGAGIHEKTPIGELVHNVNQ